MVARIGREDSITSWIIILEQKSEIERIDFKVSQAFSCLCQKSKAHRVIERVKTIVKLEECCNTLVKLQNRESLN